jgi:hypothetical protein
MALEGAMTGFFQVLENDGNTARLECCEELDNSRIIGVIDGKSEIFVRRNKKFGTKRFIKVYPPGRFFGIGLSTIDDDADDRKWARLYRRALKDFKKGVPPLATYSSERGTVVVMRAAATGVPGNPNPVGIYLNGHERIPGGGFIDFHDENIAALGITNAQYKKLPLAKRAQLNAQIQVELYGCRKK